MLALSQQKSISSITNVTTASDIVKQQAFNSHTQLHHIMSQQKYITHIRNSNILSDCNVFCFFNSFTVHSKTKSSKISPVDYNNKHCMLQWMSEHNKNTGTITTKEGTSPISGYESIRHFASSFYVALITNNFIHRFMNQYQACTKMYHFLYKKLKTPQSGH